MKKIVASFLCWAIIFILSGISSAAEKIFYYHTDQAGTSLAITDESGTVVWKADYKPFGEEHSINPAAVENNEKFIGKEKDKETGLYYFGQRYMKDDKGRFFSPDPVGPYDPMTGMFNEQILMNPQRLNPYAYALNNPYSYVDHDGKFAFVIAPLAIPFLEALGYTVLGLTTFKVIEQAYHASKNDAGEVASKGGRHGGKEHQDRVRERADQLEDEGHEITAGGGRLPERAVRTPEGKKRFPDISSVDSEGKPYHENVGKQTKGGNPVSRERKAIQDIDRATGGKTGFTPYND